MQQLLLGSTNYARASAGQNDARAMPALRTVHLLLCWLPSALSAEACDCEQYGTLSAERGDAACGSLAATNDRLAAGNNGSLCFDSCCTSLQEKQPPSPLAQMADSPPRWWPWLVIARLLCQCFALLSTHQPRLLHSHTDAPLQVILLLLAANFFNLWRSGVRPSEFWRALRSPGRKGWFQAPSDGPASRATLAGIQSDFLEDEEDDYEEDEDEDEDEDEPVLQISVRPSVGGNTPFPQEDSTPFQQEDEITLVGLSWGSQCAPVLPLPPKSTSRVHERPSHSRSKGALPALNEAEGDEEGNEEESEDEVESWGEEGSEYEGEEAADVDVSSVDAPDPQRRAHASLVARVKDREDTIRKEGKALVKQAQSMD